MKFSLVLATVGRTEEVQRFLHSLDTQSYRDFELIVIDQNPDERLRPILASFEKRFACLHLRYPKGLSRARNIGLRHVTGDIVTFPDDDCWYPADLLQLVAQWFERYPGFDGLTGRSIDEHGRSSTARWAARAGEFNRLGAWTRGTTFTMFYRRAVAAAVCFDEELGPGAGTEWGACEETDYLLQVLENRFRCFYDPAITVHHPQPITTYDRVALARGYYYAAGMGRVLNKHDFPLWFVAYTLLRPFGGALLALSRLRWLQADYHFTIMRRRLYGWRA